MLLPYGTSIEVLAGHKPFLTLSDAVESCLRLKTVLLCGCPLIGCAPEDERGFCKILCQSRSSLKTYLRVRKDVTLKQPCLGPSTVRARRSFAGVLGNISEVLACCLKLPVKVPLQF